LTRCAFVLIAALAASGLTGCGGLSLPGSGPDRSELAQHTVQTYWFEIGHGKVNQAYDMLTSGNQRTQTRDQYDQNMYGFLTSVAGVNVKAGKPYVNGDLATVPVSLYSPKSPLPLKAYQHLYWENGQWRISDANGGLSHQA